MNNKFNQINNFRKKTNVSQPNNELKLTGRTSGNAFRGNQNIVERKIEEKTPEEYNEDENVQNDVDEQVENGTELADKYLDGNLNPNDLKDSDYQKLNEQLQEKNAQEQQAKIEQYKKIEVSELINKKRQKMKTKANKELLKKIFLSKYGVILIAIGVCAIIIMMVAFYIESHDVERAKGKNQPYEELPVVDNSNNYCKNITLIKENSDYYAAHPENIVSNIDDVNLDEMWDSNNDGKNDKKRWDDPKSYSLESYVTGVVQAEASHVGDAKVYEVAGIVARTYALEIAGASTNCYVWNNENARAEYHNPQNFTEDTATTEVSTGVSKTAGVVIVKAKSSDLFDLSNQNYYDNFCYKKKVMDTKAEENSIHNYFIMQQEGDKKGIRLYADWINENMDGGQLGVDKYNNSGKYDGQCQPNGVGLYITKNLMNREYNPYNARRIINYFYGYDVEIKKIPTPSGGGGGACGQFSMVGTDLSREEFISMINSFNSKYSDFQTLKQYAGQIYDLSVANGFNPELVYARAEVEGYSPGGSSYNYYGLGCANGHPEKCKRYPSVMAGVSDFMNTMQGYGVDTLFDVYNEKHYAFIGYKWYSIRRTKRGGIDWGIGGCAYLSSMEKYMDPARYNVVRSACDSGNEIPTTPEDQGAYSYFQIEKMNKARKDIFGIDPENCEESSGGVDGVTKPVSKECSAMTSALFPNGIPTTQAEIEQYQTYVTVPITKKSGERTTVKLKVHKAIANDVVKALTDAQNGGFVVYDAQTQRDWGRCSRESQGAKCGLTMSQHCYGLAIDINVLENPFTTGPNPNSGSPYAITHETALYKSFTSLGWTWGGDWHQAKKDYMHFSYMGS